MPAIFAFSREPPKLSAFVSGNPVPFSMLDVFLYASRIESG